MPSSGEYLPCIALAGAVVINIGIKKLSCGKVKLLSKAMIKKVQNGLSSQIIEVTSCIKKLDATIEAEDLRYFSS
jgi:hypothetical protein